MTEKLFTIRDVQNYLNISQSAAYELVHRKDFPCCRIGGTIRVPRDAFFCLGRDENQHLSSASLLYGRRYCQLRR